MLACGEREALVMASPTTRASAVLPCFHGCLTFLHRHFPPHPPPSHPLNLSLCSQQQPSPWDYSTIPKLHIPVRGMYGCGKDCLILIPFRLLQISCFTLSLKCFSSESDNCPDVGIRLLHQFPHPLRAGPVVLALLFSPLVPSHRVLCGSMYSFPLVRYSCLLSAGGLYALLCLKVYSWCIHGERCTPHPPTPPPSCSPGIMSYSFLIQLANVRTWNWTQAFAIKLITIALSCLPVDFFFNKRFFF